MIKFEEQVLHVQNLNPEVETHWRMTNWELFVMGLKCIDAAIRR